MGDSKGDLWMLLKDADAHKTVRTPVLITKEPELKKHAKKHGIKTFQWHEETHKTDIRKVLEKSLPLSFSEKAVIAGLAVVLLYMLFFT